MAMLQEIQKLHSKIENIPGVPDPVAKVEADSFANSPFADEISKIDLPKKFTVPSMKTYDGTSDPQNHVAIFKQKMLAASVPSELRQFASSRQMAKRPSNLFRVKQLSDETIKEFLARFVKEKVAIPRCDEETAVEAFRQGVLLDSDIYADLTKKACTTFATVKSIVLEYVILEEDLNFRTNSSGETQNYGYTNRKSSYHKGNNSRSAPYSRPNRSEVNMAQECKGLIKRLENLGDTVRWPKKSDNPRKDPSRWCDFHQDIGHTTE
ncbi:uncharacterized protein LOC141618300 [Silene latifolia]|uniref:uncharacterized protein LOC141618300 n=1 Tax=Silene latifolia TaxID=37657 RepID=UPI003D7758EF